MSERQSYSTPASSSSRTEPSPSRAYVICDRQGNPVPVTRLGPGECEILLRPAPSPSLPAPDAPRSYAICDRQGQPVPATRIGPNESEIWLRRRGTDTLESQTPSCG